MDVKTLFLANAITDACMALALGLYLLTRKTYPGFRTWTAATTTFMVAGLVVGLRGPIPEGLSILLSNLIYPLAAVWRLQATRAFLGLTPARRTWYLLPALSLASSVYFFYAADLPQWRVVVVSLAIAYPAGHVALLFIRHAPRPGALFHYVIGLSLGLLLVVMLVRAGAVVGDPQFQLLESSPAQVLFLAFLLPLHLVLNIFIIMLNSQRLETELSLAESGLRGSVEELTQALAEVKTLSGLLPICARCKKIRDDSGYWQQIEQYLEAHSSAQFTHGLCPECMLALYPQYVRHGQPPSNQGGGSPLS